MARTLKKSHSEAETGDVTRDLETRMDEVLRHFKGEDVGMRSRTVTLDLTSAQVARRKSGLSQGEFCKRLGISIATLRNWEQGRREPTGPAKVLIDLLSRRPELLDFVGDNRT